MLRPLHKESGDRKRDSEVSQSERATIRKQQEKSAFLRRNPHRLKDRKK